MEGQVFFRGMNMISLSVLIHKQGHVAGHLSLFKVAVNEQPVGDSLFPFVRSFLQVVRETHSLLIVGKVKRPVAGIRINAFEVAKRAGGLIGDGDACLCSLVSHPL